MSTSVVRPPTSEETKVKSEQELEIERWRIAVAVVKRLREFGISCGLVGDKEPH
jgi:hypothetical protein